MEKLLTISIAAYNVEKYLEQVLNSCLVDTANEDLDIIVVDDGSKDKTKKIAEKYQEKYPEFIRCISKKNGGYGSTINTSLKYAYGKYFKLLDGDDWYDGKELQILLGKLRKCDSDMVINNYTEVYEGTGERKVISYPSIEKDKVLDFEDICNGLVLSMHAVMYKTEVLRRMKLQILEHCFYTDTLYLLLPIPYIKTVMYIDRNIYQYRLALGGQSVSVEGIRKHYKDGQKVLDVLVSVLNSLDKYSNRYSYMLGQVTLSAKFQMSAYLYLPCSREVKQQIIDFDKKLKRQQPDVYEAMSNKKTKWFRKTGYIFYGLYSRYMTYKARN